jgi:hypothetical protein
MGQKNTSVTLRECVRCIIERMSTIMIIIITYGEYLEMRTCDSSLHADLS